MWATHAPTHGHRPTLTEVPGLPRRYASYYGLTPPSSARGRGSQAVAEFLDGYMNFTDLATYASTFNLTHLPATTVIGPNQQGTPGLEAQVSERRRWHVCVACLCSGAPQAAQGVGQLGVGSDCLHRCTSGADGRGAD